MKRIIALITLMCVLAASVFVVAESDKWLCPSCGITANGNFCMNCGTRRLTGDPNAEQYEVGIHIDFEENLMFSTYAVEMYIDNVFVTKMEHGRAYDGSVRLTAGSHAVKFAKSGDLNVCGTCNIVIEGDCSFSCGIQAKNNRVKITDDKVTTGGLETATGAGNDAAVQNSGDGAQAGETITPIRVNGNYELELTVYFRKNLMFSTYDVDMYFDGEFIATLPHGEDYSGTLLVSKGVHMIYFYKHGDKTTKGVAQFSVNYNTTFSCHIHAMSLGVWVTEEKLYGLNMDKGEYMSSCVTVEYNKAARYPDDYVGQKIYVSGKVTRLQEGYGGSLVQLLVSDSDKNEWYVFYIRPDGESRILVDDKVTVYGLYDGVTDYTIGGLSGSEPIPAVIAQYIDIR